ncbi:sigma 54-interacting transcriptional regulator [Xanthomonas sacchari]|nr:sigma 54-interacting transcriptional regulator [Xanthomonas sacchari]
MTDNRTPPLPRILVVDDQADVREALRMLLKSAGYGMVGAESPELALACLRGDAFAAVLVDMNYARDTTSGAEGLALIAQIAAQWPGLPVIAMTAWASIELAVAAMREGAVDFIEKPWQNARVLAVLESRIALDRSRRAAQRLGEAQSLLLQDGAAGFVAESAPMQQLVEDLLRIAGSGANVLLLGENGTGKSLLAQLLHQWSPRRTQAFVKVNIGGLAPTLFEAELFGHVRGAYTDARQDRAGRFELADGGTLFLDEIGNLPLQQQPKLLRAIEDGEFERLGSSRTQRGGRAHRRGDQCRSGGGRGGRPLPPGPAVPAQHLPGARAAAARARRRHPAAGAALPGRRLHPLPAAAADAGARRRARAARLRLARQCA